MFISINSTMITALLCMLTATGCATSATAFKPQDLPKHEVAFMGRVQVLNFEDDITSSCHAEFTDSKGSRKLYVSLDKTGWVFETSKREEAYLSRVVCEFGSVFKNYVQYDARDLHFHPGSAKQMTYFGSVTIRFSFTPYFNFAYLLTGGMGAAFIAANPEDGGKDAQVANQLPDAAKEYRRRYGQAGVLYQLAYSLASAPTVSRLPASANVPSPTK